ncbi:MAG: hypothetical protein WDZ48_01860, partial [Pirellulales bacterium]
QRIIADVRAARIDSRMDPAVSLYDSAGRRLAFARGTHRHDAIVDVSLESDGEYLLKLHDFTYQGGDEYFYRLALHDGPHIDFVVPAAGEPGSKGRFMLYGRNLPGSKPSEVELRGAKLEQVEVEIPLPKDAPLPLSAENLHTYEAGLESIAYTLESPQGESNPVTIYLAEAPVVLEQEPNDEPSKAQAVTAPCEFVGQFYPQSDRDWITFQAKKDEALWMEVISQRMGLATDPYLLVQHVTKNDKGEEQVK